LVYFAFLFIFLVGGRVNLSGIIRYYNNYKSCRRENENNVTTIKQVSKQALEYKEIFGS
jgi:hypothetical protein